MFLGRLIGWLLLAAALMSLGWDVVASLDANRIVINALGEQWFAYDRDSLTATQRLVQENIPFLWDPVMMTLLRWPGWIVFALLGILFLLIFRKRRRRDRWFIQ
jgi:TRAP-type mannitol/chloroaromatic compound transport system permease small subunit